MICVSVGMHSRRNVRVEAVASEPAEKWGGVGS